MAVARVTSIIIITIIILHCPIHSALNKGERLVFYFTKKKRQKEGG